MSRELMSLPTVKPTSSSRELSTRASSGSGTFQSRVAADAHRLARSDHAVRRGLEEQLGPLGRIDLIVERAPRLPTLPSARPGCGDRLRRPPRLPARSIGASNFTSRQRHWRRARRDSQQWATAAGSGGFENLRQRRITRSTWRNRHHAIALDQCRRPRVHRLPNLGQLHCRFQL